MEESLLMEQEKLKHLIDWKSAFVDELSLTLTPDSEFVKVPLSEDIDRFSAIFACKDIFYVLKDREITHQITPDGTVSPVSSTPHDSIRTILGGIDGKMYLGPRPVACPISKLPWDELPGPGLTEKTMEVWEIPSFQSDRRYWGRGIGFNITSPTGDFPVGTAYIYRNKPVQKRFGVVNFAGKYGFTTDGDVLDVETGREFQIYIGNRDIHAALFYRGKYYAIMRKIEEGTDFCLRVSRTQ